MQFWVNLRSWLFSLNFKTYGTHCRLNNRLGWLLIAPKKKGWLLIKQNIFYTVLCKLAQLTWLTALTSLNWFDWLTNLLYLAVGLRILGIQSCQWIAKKKIKRGKKNSHHIALWTPLYIFIKSIIFWRSLEELSFIFHLISKFLYQVRSFLFTLLQTCMIC